MDNTDKKQAFVLRQPDVKQSLESDEVCIGWGLCKGLIQTDDWNDFKKKLSDAYKSYKDNNSSLGQAAGSLWRFIHDIKKGDYVLVPSESGFYIAEINSDIKYDEKRAIKEYEDYAYYREVKWLYDKNSINRAAVSNTLQLKLKSRQTIVRAGDVVKKEIETLIRAKNRKQDITFEEELHDKLINATLESLTKGKINDTKFERLIGDLLRSFGITEVTYRRGKSDKGADIIARINLLGISEITLAIQAKHYKPEPPIKKDVVEQLKIGMEQENADLGWIVTTGTFSREAEELVNDLYENEVVKIDLIDGERLSEMIINHGISKKLLSINTEAI